MGRARLLSSLLLLAILVAPLTPTTSAHPASQCTSTHPEDPCTFLCMPGEVLRVEGVPFALGGRSGAIATCGGAVATCSGTGACAANSPTLVPGAGVGVCAPTRMGVAAQCISAHNEAGVLGRSCTVTLDGDVCSFRCEPGQRVHVEALSLQSGGYPKVVGSCGGQEAQCQEFYTCKATSPGSTLLGWGTCRAYTTATRATCYAA